METENIAISTGIDAAGGLPADQLIFTAPGARAVGKIGAGSGVSVFSYDLPGRRFLRVEAKLMAAGTKALVKVHTDKGAFVTAAGQQVMLEDGSWVAAAELEPGRRLRAFTTPPIRHDLVEGEGDFFRPIEHELIAAECAVANWYPTSAVTPQGAAEVCVVTLETAVAFSPNVLLWIPGPAGGVGIVIAAQRAN